MNRIASLIGATVVPAFLAAGAYNMNSSGAGTLFFGGAVAVSLLQEFTNQERIFQLQRALDKLKAQHTAKIG
jgi:hypothetical protein